MIFNKKKKENLDHQVEDDSERLSEKRPDMSIKEMQRKEEKERKKQIKKDKEIAKEALKISEKNRFLDLKKDKEEMYIIRKNTLLKVTRILLWTILIFIFIKGVIVSIRPDPTAKVNNTIEIFKSEFSGYQEQDNEILAYAQNFAVRYLTYNSGDELKYAESLRTYTTDSISNIGYKFPSGTSATVVYAQAYRKEAYSATQTDVWVTLNVKYTHKNTTADKIIEEVVETEVTTLKVPVSMKNNYYIIEDLPVFVNDDLKLYNFETISFKGVECQKEITTAIETALTNFYMAYYEQPQDVINYYLSPEADSNKFIGLDGRVLFDKISSIRAYHRDENNTTNFIVILTLDIIDKNGVKVHQNYNLEVIYKDKQYYVLTMDTRNTNLNIMEAID